MECQQRGMGAWSILWCLATYNHMSRVVFWLVWL